MSNLFPVTTIRNTIDRDFDNLLASFFGPSVGRAHGRDY